MKTVEEIKAEILSLCNGNKALVEIWLDVLINRAILDSKDN